MRLAASSIAWPEGQDAAAADLLLAHGATAVELAPGKIWPSPLESTARQRRDHRRFWESRGLPAVAMQALLFGRPELTIFDDADTRTRTADYLAGVIDLAADLGVGALVFGSPRNRARGRTPEAEAWSVAVDFFGRLGDRAAARGVWFCIGGEPGPLRLRLRHHARGRRRAGGGRSAGPASACTSTPAAWPSPARRRPGSTAARCATST